MVPMCPQLANLHVVGNMERSWQSHSTNVIIYECDAGVLRPVPGGALTGHTRLGSGSRWETTSSERQTDMIFRESMGIEFI